MKFVISANPAAICPEDYSACNEYQYQKKKNDGSSEQSAAGA
jgi:hypothetical protein